MLKRKIVFVIGAGAHCPYGFPDGGKLTRDIVAMLPANLSVESEFSQQMYSLYGAPGIGKVIVDFRDKLNESGHGSIDSVLATYASRPGFSEIGRYAVAKVLFPIEFKASFSWDNTLRPDDPDYDWLSYLFRHMAQGCLTSADDFLEGNKATFVTFNYDRTLELFFQHRLKHTYGLSAQEALEKLKKIPIVHVYGSLGEYNGSYKSDQPTPTEILNAAVSIRLMYDDRKDHPQVEAAKIAISESDDVCFLGFSFDPDNLARLDLRNLCAGKRVFASRYKMPDGDWARASLNFAPNNLAPTSRDWDALKFLQETRALG